MTLHSTTKTAETANMVELNRFSLFIGLTQYVCLLAVSITECDVYTSHFYFKAKNVRWYTIIFLERIESLLKVLALIIDYYVYIVIVNGISLHSNPE